MYPIDETQNKVNPSGYSNENPFWVTDNTIGGQEGVALPGGKKGQYLSLNNTTTNPKTENLIWKDIDIPEIDTSSLANKEDIENLQKQVSNNQTAITGAETNINKNTEVITELENNKADKTYVNQQIELVSESTDNKLKGYVEKSIYQSDKSGLESNITNNTEGITQLQTSLNKTNTTLTNLETKHDTDVSKLQGDINTVNTELGTLQTTIDNEMAELNADIIPSKVILEESMKEGNENKVYGFRRGTEEGVLNEAIEVLTLEDLTETGYMLNDMSNSKIPEGSLFSNAVTQGTYFLVKDGNTFKLRQNSGVIPYNAVEQKTYTFTNNISSSDLTQLKCIFSINNFNRETTLFLTNKGSSSITWSNYIIVNASNVFTIILTFSLLYNINNDRYTLTVFQFKVSRGSSSFVTLNNIIISDYEETEVDLSNYYNKEEVNNLISEIPSTDLTNYYTKTETDDLISGIEINKEGLVTSEELNETVNNLQTNINSTVNEVTAVKDALDVTSALANKTSEDLINDYYTKTEVDDKIDQAGGGSGSFSSVDLTVNNTIYQTADKRNIQVVLTYELDRGYKLGDVIVVYYVSSTRNVSLLSITFNKYVLSSINNIIVIGQASASGSSIGITSNLTTHILYEEFDNSNDFTLTYVSGYIIGES